MNDPEVEEPKGIRFSVMVCATRGFPCEGKIIIMTVLRRAATCANPCLCFVVMAFCNVVS